jgi:hypothetical protein
VTYRMRATVPIQPSHFCRRIHRISFVCAAWTYWTLAVTGQPVLLEIRQNRGQAALSWPAGLSLVQPQKSTNLAAGSWLDLGAATASTNFLDAPGTPRAFYRLRFLPPSIVGQPQPLTVLPGGNALLSVTSSGTTPMSYQWLRNGTNLNAQTAASLTVSNVTLADAGDFTVIISNRAGAATSAVATLTVTAPAALLPGIYMGKFTGQTNTGGFAFLLRTNGQAIALGSSAPEGGSLFTTNLVVAPNGAFTATIENVGKLTGTFAGSSVNGTFTSTNGFAGAFSGASKPVAGIHETNAGFYVGTFAGLLSGTVHQILAADGTAFTFLVATGLASGGSYGTISAANTLASTATVTLPGTTTPGILGINGTLNPVTHQLSGSYSFSGITLGEFLLTRVLTP